MNRPEVILFTANELGIHKYVIYFPCFVLPVAVSR
jgi:hypothetical protein